MTITIEYFEVRADKEFDNPSKGLLGVEILFYLYSPDPNEEGDIRIHWGNYVSETIGVAHYALMLGQNYLGMALPPGTHNICMEVL